MSRMQKAEQFRKAMQLYAESLPDKDAMTVASIFGLWAAGAHYEAGSCIAYGCNLVGDPQLYRVQQSHTAQADWAPDKTPSLFAPIGLGKDGIPLWAQPAGAHDAYCIGDAVEFDGAVYRSLRDGNIHSPTVYPEGWEALTTGG